MKVLVIGASGGTGKLIVQKLLAQGHDVTAFVRSPAAFDPKPNLNIIVGSAEDAASVDRAVAGHEAVLCAFGPRSLGKGTIQETLMRNLLPALEKHGVKRLINLSAWGAGESRVHGNLMFKILRLTMLRHTYDDKERGEVLLLASPINYINVRPGRLLDSPARGGVKASNDGRGLKPELTRADLADFMVSQLTASEWLRKSPLIGY